MKKFNQLWKRIVAFALALILVLGYVPVVGVSAEEATADTTRKDVLVKATMVAVGKAEPTEETAVGEEQPAVYTSYTYNVTVEALDKDTVKDVTQEAVITTVIDGVTVNGCENYTAGADKEFDVTVSYKGVEFTFSSKDAQQKGTLVQSLEAEYKTAYTLTSRQKFSADAYAPKLNKENKDGKWSFRAEEHFGEYIDEGVVVADEASKVKLGTFTYEIGENGILAEIELIVNVTKPTYDVTITGADATSWYSEAVAVTVTAKANTELSVDALPDNLPEVKADGAEIGAWSKKDDAKTFACQVKVSETTTVTAGKTSLTVHVDTVRPEIRNVASYLGGSDTYVLLDYNVGASGIASVEVTIGEKTYTITKCTDIGAGKCSIVLEGVSAKEITAVKLTNGAGVASEPYPPEDPEGENGGINVTEPIAVELTNPAFFEDGNTAYISNGAVMTVTISNVSNEENSVVYLNPENITISYDDSDGKTGTKAVAAWKYEDGTYTGSFEINNGDKNISVTAKGANGRDGTDSDMRTFALDDKAPEIALAGDRETKYANSELTYTVTICDAVYLDVDNAPANISVSYMIKGEEKESVATVVKRANEANTYTASISVKDGQTLEKICVAATDNAGNATTQDYECNVTVDTKRPVVTVTPSKNITAFYQNDDGIYAQVAAIDENDVTASFEVRVTDANLPEEALEGWSIGEDGAWTKTFSAVIKPHETGDVLSLKIPEIKDKAGWVISNHDDITAAPGIIIAVEKTTDDSKLLLNTVDMNYEEGEGFCLDVRFDRRGPSSDAAAAIPELSLTMPEPVCVLGEKNVYNGESDLTFKVMVTDLYQPSEDETEKSGSGIATVAWSVSDGLGGEFLEWSDKSFEDVANGTALELPVAIMTGAENETDKAQITITVTDYLGNQTLFTSAQFIVDNKAPEVEVVYSQDAEAQVVDEIAYFPAGRTASIKVTDLTLDLDAVSFRTNGTKADDGNGEYTCEFLADGDYFFYMSARDLAGNLTADDKMLKPDETANAVNYDGEHCHSFITDTAAPEITVEKTVGKEGTKGYVQTIDGVDYFDSAVTYTVTITDANLNPDAVALVTEIDGEKVEVTRSETINERTQKDTVAYSFTLRDGNVLTDMTLSAFDCAGKAFAQDGKNLKVVEPEETGTTAIDFIEADECWKYCGNTVIVDMTAPEITVEKTVGEEGAKGYVQTVDGVDYFDSAVTYTVTITDANLNPDAVALMTEIDGEKVEVTRSETINELTQEDTVAYSFTLRDGNVLTGMTLTAPDCAGNAFAKDDENLKIDEPEETGTTAFARKEDEHWGYSGNTVVVDMTAPTATMAFSENVVSVYTNGSTIYVRLKEPAVGDSGLLAEQKEETVTTTITVEDKNIALYEEHKVEIGIKTNDGDGEWKVNEENKIVYEQSIAVKADKTGTFSFELSVHDLAGNALEKLACGLTESNTTVNEEAVKVDDGTFGATISVDRRRPSSKDEDSAPPVIVITPKTAPAASSNGRDLFGGAVDFDLYVTDGERNNLNSGLQRISWEAADKNGKVAFAENSSGTVEPDSGTKEEANSGKHEWMGTIPVAMAEAYSGESNDVSLTITVVDNVGNTTTYVKEFAMDNLAPRITVRYDNNSVLNGRYFKADRTATITVTDINLQLDPENRQNLSGTTITTQVGHADWIEEGNGVWSTTCAYTTDGEYTFHAVSTDLMGNAGSTVDYGNSAAPEDFVIDKTAPVITVTYDPSAPVGRDDKGVGYYDKNVNVVVSIREVNFRAGDVNAQFNSDNALSVFTGGPDVYSASETFGEGNEYRFSVAYTDLAGNAAVPYQSETFSVDLHEPTIEITEGSMTTEALNIVQDDLVLGFTINDAQSNLKNYSVSVTHLNNEFQEVPVSGADIYTVTGADERTTVRVHFTNIEKEKVRDGIYTVEITAEDYAGHKVTLAPEPELVFSLNRFGSTFMTDDPFTQSFLTPGADDNVYQNAVDKKLIFKEINPNRVWQDSDHTAKGSVLTVVVNGTTTALKEGVNYTVAEHQEGKGNAKWYVYTYEVEPGVFMKDDRLVDGRYALLIYSEDEAGNKNTNESNEFAAIRKDGAGEYSGKIEFTLDTTAPIISTTGIENGGSYNTTNQKLKIFLSDNTPVSIVVNLNGQTVAAAENAGADHAAWLIWDDAEGCYVLNVPEQNVLFGRQNVEIQVTDAAGNSAAAEITDFTVSSNLFVRLVNNVWFWVVCAALLLAILLVVILLKKKKTSVAA